MKRLLGLLLVLMLLVSIITTINGCAPKELPTITLKWAEYGTADDERMVYYKRFIDRISEESKGRITIEMYDSEKLVKSAQMYDALAEGTIDMAAFNMAYYAGKNPMACLLSEAAAVERGDMIVVASRMATTWDSYFVPQGMKYLGWGVEFPVLSFAGPKLFKVPADLKGLKIRAPGSEVAALEQCGGKGVSIAIPELYMALQRGTVDGTLNTLTNMKVLRLYEVVPALTITRFGSAACPVAINLKKWESLPDDVKNVLQKVSREMPEWHYKTYKAVGDDYEKIGEKFKMSYKWTGQEDKDWRALFAGAHVKRATEKYGNEAKEVWNKVLAVVQDCKAANDKGQIPRFFD
jgi:TRAP-type C4-dicarboxylate transport system substrate-binding protein